MILQCTSAIEIGHSYKELDDSEYNYIKINSSLCDVAHLGQWDDASNCQRFYTCEVNSKLSPYCDIAYGQATSSDHLVRPTSNKSTGESSSSGCLHLRTQLFYCPLLALKHKVVSKHCLCLSYIIS
jgi:hypothetical protein